MGNEKDLDSLLPGLANVDADTRRIIEHLLVQSQPVVTKRAVKKLNNLKEAEGKNPNQ